MMTAAATTAIEEFQDWQRRTGRERSVPQRLVVGCVAWDGGNHAVYEVTIVFSTHATSEAVERYTDGMEEGAAVAVAAAKARTFGNIPVEIMEMPWDAADRECEACE